MGYLHGAGGDHLAGDLAPRGLVAHADAVAQGAVLQGLALHAYLQGAALHHDLHRAATAYQTAALEQAGVQDATSGDLAACALADQVAGLGVEGLVQARGVALLDAQIGRADLLTC